ncbi:MAG: hypothetical protein ACKO5P_06640 [Nodosilinea sp.]
MGLIGLTVAMAACYSWRPNPEPSPPPSRPLSDSIAPPPPPAGSFLGQLSPEQTNQLTSLGIEVVVPGVVSPDFKAVDLRVDHRDQALGYMVVYRHRQGQCFAVEFANGDPTPLPPTQSALAIQPPLFGGQGYFLHYGKFKETKMQTRFPGSNLYSDWLSGPSGAYRLVGAAYIKELFPALDSCQDVDPRQAVKLVESFTLVTTAPMGDDLKSTP